MGIDKDRIDALLKRLRSDDWYLRDSAIMALGNQPRLPEAAVAAIAEALHDESCDVRMHAAATLARVRPGLIDAASFLAGYLTHSRPCVRPLRTRTRRCAPRLPRSCSG
jgi:hypothetical protein